MKRLIVLGAVLLGGCTAVIDQGSFFPQQAEAPKETLTPPRGYAVQDDFAELPGLGRVHIVRLDNPASETTIIYSGGNGSFVSLLTPFAWGLSEATGADIILYDYPGRGGTDVPATIDAAIATGPALVSALRAKGWIGSGPLFAYGMSFGGSQAAAMTRAGGFSGLIIEGSAADIATVGRNFIPDVLKPFMRLQVDPALSRFDYLGYATSSKAPVLLIASKADKIVTVKNMKAFADQLRARGSSVEMVTVPGPHGRALAEKPARDALGAFVAKHSRR
jgi:pimeloyl-ACP methyl ester carboxylesterase